MAEVSSISVTAVAEKFLKELSSADREKLFSECSKFGNISDVANESRKRKRSNQSSDFRACSSASATPVSDPEIQAAGKVITICNSSDSEDGREVNDLSESESSLSAKACVQEQSSDCEHSVEENHSDTNDDSIVSLPQESESEEESESEDDWDWDDVINIDDDDDDEGQNSKDASREMVCFRCPNKRLGRFKDREKFRIHLKRHVFGDHFTCATCGRPFTKINYCISHEIRVHGAQIDYDKKDPVISFAKRYVEAKNAKRAAAAGNPNATQETDDEETDAEDAKFYSDDIIVSSTTLFSFRGPRVNNVLEAYEIQVNHSRPKFQRATQTARMALEVHEYNVERNQDTYRLGRFSKINKKAVWRAAKKKAGETSKKTVCKPQGTAKRVLSDGSDVERTENPKKKRKVRTLYITSSSSSSSEDNSDSDYQPSRKKRRVSGSEIASDEQLKTTLSSKRKNENRDKKITVTRKLLEPVMINRICQLCNYVWKTGEDLRLHRDAIHPNLPMTDLLPVVEYKERVKSKPKFHKSKSAEPVKIGEASAAPPAKKKPKGKACNSARKTVKKVVGKVKATKGKSKGKQTPPLCQRKQIAPTPNSTYSEKEKYLHALGLINVVRLDVFRNKGKGVQLPKCSVMLKRLNRESTNNS